MYNSLMAVMTISEARAALPEVLTRVAAGEEITITRHGSPIAMVVRPDIIWRQPAAPAMPDDTQELVTILRERARRQQELRVLLDAAERTPGRDPLPPIRLTTVRTAQTAAWSREEIYGDEGR